MAPNVLRAAAALVSGLVFGLGLAVSGMMNPAKVIGFLDVAGDWDPTLLFVMVGALLVAVPAYRLIPRRGRPVLEEEFSLPEKKAVDAPLLGGSALFGVGWGIVGFCPGPAIAALGTGLLPVFAFVAAMLAGMALHARLRGS
ncbi:MAG: GENE II AND X PROTEINS [uncultured Rubrobacteraceae bacterium]|uniref:GENE II AND X PROTEINS n=1 Tax=uncultured Rubrobacteraceae bacterium TaxID=349277 RepID=A0A6J4U444_9ACTN|nr:MAG: GENE II AND X PROTEINS [uncultured Rubrobacteraceae bacterium]